MANLRARRDDDLDPLVRIAADVRASDGYPPFLPGGDFHAFLTRPAPLDAWVAEVGGRVVGHVALNAETHPEAMAVVRDAGIPGSLGVIARLFVDRSVRRRGFGQQLLERAVEHAKAVGRMPVLDVHATALAALDLYRSAGWQELGRCAFTLPDVAPIGEVVFGLPASVQRHRSGPAT